LTDTRNSSKIYRDRILLLHGFIGAFDRDVIHIITRQEASVNIRKLSIFALILGAIILTGCTGSTPVVRTSTLTPEPLPKDCHLDIYTSEADITKRYETVCMNHTETARALFKRHSVDAALDRIRPKVCSCGAHALIVTDMAKQGAFPSWGAGYGFSTVKVKAIRYTD
jgi:hypothetical protein